MRGYSNIRLDTTVKVVSSLNKYIEYFMLSAGYIK